MANPESKKLAVDVIARIDKLEKGMAKARKATNDNFRAMESRADRFKGKMAGIGKSAFAPFAAGAAAALAPMAAFNRAMNDISAASNLAKAADRVGLATKAYQELAFGFQLAGVEAATFETGMEQFTRRIAEAEAKGGTLAKILKANGIALRTSSGEMRSAESLLADYADLMKNAASEQERMLLATEAFGRGGADFVLALKNGSDGLRDMKRATEEAGGTIDEQLLRKAEVLDDKFAAMWRTFEVNSKVAILTAVTELDGLIGKANEFGNSPFSNGCRRRPVSTMRCSCQAKASTIPARIRCRPMRVLRRRSKAKCRPRTRSCWLRSRSDTNTLLARPLPPPFRRPSSPRRAALVNPAVACRVPHLWNATWSSLVVSLRTSNTSVR